MSWTEWTGEWPASLSVRGPWYGSERGCWESEASADCRLVEKFGGDPCTCDATFSSTYLHFTSVATPCLEPPPTFRTGRGAPVVRCFTAHRDCFGRFCSPRDGTYWWRADVDAFIEWYEGQLAGRAAVLLAEDARAAV